MKILKRYETIQAPPVEGWEIVDPKAGGSHEKRLHIPKWRKNRFEPYDWETVILDLDRRIRTGLGVEYHNWNKHVTYRKEGVLIKIELTGPLADYDDDIERIVNQIEGYEVRGIHIERVEREDEVVEHKVVIEVDILAPSKHQRNGVPKTREVL